MMIDHQKSTLPKTEMILNVAPLWIPGVQVIRITVTEQCTCLLY